MNYTATLLKKDAKTNNQKMPNQETKGTSVLGMLPAVGAIAQGVGQAFGIGNKRQVKQQAKLNAEQVKSQKEMADYSQKNQKEMWDYTNYGNQVKHLKEAGLNPALLYGTSGGGGATVGQGGGMGISGASAEGPSKLTEGLAQAGQGMAMLPAQIELIKAQTENVKADTLSKGAEPALKEAQTASLTQGIENAKQQQMLTEVQTRLAKINETIAAGTLEDVMDRVSYETEKAANEMEVALNEAYVSSATRQEKIIIFQQEAIAGILNNALTKVKTAEGQSNIEVNKAKIQQMASQIAQGWAGLEISDRQTAIQKFKEEVTANYPNLMNTVGKLIDDGISTIFEIGGRFRRKFKSVEGNK